MTEKIKILFLAANPQDVKFRLDLDKEVSAIAEKIRSGTSRDCFELMSEWCAKRSLLQQHLRDHAPDVLHFSGHGSRSKGLAFEDDAGRRAMVSKQAFIRVIKLRKDKIRLAVLNACETSGPARMLSEAVDYVIGMNRPILDEAAKVFAATFYQGLAFGDPVDQAFESGLADLDLMDIKGSNIPELFVRSGVDRSKPFLPHPYADRETDRGARVESYTPQEQNRWPGPITGSFADFSTGSKVHIGDQKIINKSGTKGRS
jgi:hypothetical protein